MSLTARRSYLALQPLEAREVPAALVDLTYRGAQGTANGALFQQSDAHPTGSGVIHSFLRVQATGVEQGFNTDARPLQLDENNSRTFTRSLPVGEVPVVTINGVKYREFLLDINQKSSSPLLSLDELRLYVGSSPNLTGYSAASKTLAGLAPVYDMDGTQDTVVKMDYRLNPGSGGGDITVLIPDSAFAGASANSYVYLYSKFGQTWGGNSGFEEWAVQARACACQTPPATSPTSVSGTVFFDTDGDHAISPGDQGMPGIEVDLLDATGNLIAKTTTNTDGGYNFNNLAAGTYTVQMTIPTGDWGNLYPNIGSVGGDVNLFWSGFNGIKLNAGDAGTSYNMGLYDSAV